AEERAATRHGLDECFVREHAERMAQGAAADAEGPREIDFSGQALAGAVHTIAHVLPHPRSNLCVKRYGPIPQAVHTAGATLPLPGGTVKTAHVARCCRERAQRIDTGLHAVQ